MKGVIFIVRLIVNLILWPYWSTKIRRFKIETFAALTHIYTGCAAQARRGADRDVIEQWLANRDQTLREGSHELLRWGQKVQREIAEMVFQDPAACPVPAHFDRLWELAFEFPANFQVWPKWD